MESYFGSKEEHIFKNVAVMIFVIDVTSSEDKDIEDYKTSMELLNRHSTGAKVFCLVHKMDLIPKEHRDATFDEKKEILEKNSQGLPITCFQTSIWHDTLYKAWSTIVYSLIPNSEILAQHLEHFCSTCQAEEVVLFERDTFLDISHSTSKNAKISTRDAHRFEKMSNIIKNFKLSCLYVKCILSN